MKGKAALLVGAAVGYVLGTRDGRERYEQIKSRASGMWQDPKVQQKVSEVSDLAKEKAPLVKDKVAEKVGSDDGTSGGSGPATTPSSASGTPTTVSTPAGPSVTGTGLGTPPGRSAGSGPASAEDLGTPNRPTPGSVGG